MKYSKQLSSNGLTVLFDFMKFVDGKFNIYKIIDCEARLIAVLDNNKIIFDYSCDVNENYKIVSFVVCRFDVEQR